VSLAPTTANTTCVGCDREITCALLLSRSFWLNHFASSLSGSPILSPQYLSLLALRNTCAFLENQTCFAVNCNLTGLRKPRLSFRDSTYYSVTRTSTIHRAWCAVHGSLQLRAASGNYICCSSGFDSPLPNYAFEDSFVPVLSLNRDCFARRAQIPTDSRQSRSNVNRVGTVRIRLNQHTSDETSMVSNRAWCAGRGSFQ
jgi:hypothetical protein